PDFRALLARVREATLGGLANQDLPFEKLVEELHPERSLGHSPVFQAFFQMVGEEAGGELEMRGLTAKALAPGGEASKFDLTLTAGEMGGGLRLDLLYNRDLWEPSTIRRMLVHLAILLAAAADAPEQPIHALPLLSEAERGQIEAWQTGPALPPGIPLFHQQFAMQAHRAPGSVAVIHNGEQVTYGELESRSNRIANHLRRMGVGPEVRVGLCMPRTPELVAALLGVIKAGGVIVPLEPHFPAERITGVLMDAEAAVVLTTRAVLDAVHPPCPALVMDDNAVREAIAMESADAPDVIVPTRSLWAVFYTSGSTGKPKGVMVPHGGLAAYVDWMVRRFPLAPGERVLAATSFCFDVHVCEVHHALASGAALVLVESALALADAPSDLRLAQAGMVPTAARELLAVGRFPAVTHRVHLGGEAVPPDLVRDLYAAGVPAVENLYGPTEDTVFSTHKAFRPDGRVTVGRPVNGRRACVLDGGLRPVPAGVVGEMYLAGCGVTRGYLGRPGLTAERFLPDPHGEPGARMYATGDRARWLPDGDIEFLGRVDFQVKVRGHRIEPGEIEAVLRRHPAVRDAVVAVRGADTTKRLVAWVVAHEGAAPEPAELAAAVKERLPAYMVPSAVVLLDAFPRTTTGKVDRNALPTPDLASEASAYVAPRTPGEQAVADVFAMVLGMERVGALDDFFALGGHSLLAMHVWSHLRDRMGVDLPLRALFEAPTPEALARVVDAAPRAEAQPEIRVTARRRTVRAVTLAPPPDDAGSTESPVAAALVVPVGGDA
ncbi:MAG TPA: amino acid adenylation domain-containing protein, partial [Longimicrobium sp.]|nr:amino acid adenylation domain-containing protein [Longimicrobium sp.]